MHISLCPCVSIWRRLLRSRHNFAQPLKVEARVAWLVRLARGWEIGIRFLTTIPWGKGKMSRAADLGCAVALFPLIGALVGGVVFGVWKLAFALGASASVAASLALTGWIVLTGGLHLDGLMDAADGLLGGYTPESRLEIMRDERVGAFGVLAAALVLLLKFAALQDARGLAIFAAAVVGRWALVLAMTLFPYARPQGLGGMWHSQATPRVLLSATFTSLALLVLTFQPWLWGAAALGGLVAWLAARWTLRRIPGLTGDVYGALAELTETAVLVAAAFLH